MLVINKKIIMEINNLENSIIKLLESNKQGVDIDVIIDYLDYVNKVRYTSEEIMEILNNLIEENKITVKNTNYHLIK